MTLGVFLDLDGVLTPKAVNLQYAVMLGVEKKLIALENQYRNGEIDNKGFNDSFVPLFRGAGFSSKFAQDHFREIVLNPYAEELIQANLPNTFIVSSSPSYYLEQFARKFGINPSHIICSKYIFDQDDLLYKCTRPCGVLEKSEFVENHLSRFAVSLGVGDSPEQDAKFLNHCTVKVLMGGERHNYLHAVDLYALQSLITMMRKFQSQSSELPSPHRVGVDNLLAKSKFERNVFIMTPFRNDARYAAAINAIKGELKKRDLNGWTADQHTVEEDLWGNVKCFMYASKYGVAIITGDEQISGDATIFRGDVHNPNVLIEVGFMLGQGKNVLLLKDKRVQLPVDWIGKLYHEINFTNPAADVRLAVNTWVKSALAATNAS